MAQENNIALPPPDTEGRMTLEETIGKRRSKREYADKLLTMDQISQILWAAQGITGRRDDTALRAAPSPGTLYTIELCVVTPQGYFHYIPKDHSLEVLGNKDLRAELSSLASRQEIIKSAPLTIVLCAVYARVTERFGERGKMYAHMEAGHIAQNVQLQAVSLGLDSVPMGAFNEGKVKDLLALPEEQLPVYMIPVGYTK